MSEAPQAAATQAAAPDRTATATPAQARVRHPPAWLWRALLLVLAGLLFQRIAYHATYLETNPFALVTLSDGQLYEQAARDIVTHPPWGTQPFYLQGLYAYLLALPMSLHTAVLNGLLAQILLAFVALFVFARTARSCFGPNTGLLSTLVLLGYPGIAFYENKYLSISLGIACNIFAIGAFARLCRRPGIAACVWLGVCSGLSLLARPNLVAALPFTALAVLMLARVHAAPRPLSWVLWLGLGVALATAPMAVRNQHVIGRAHVFPSHGGGIPFYLGNNPHANGRWNNAGGLISGQVGREREELAQALGLSVDADALDDEIGGVLYARGLRYIAEQPLDWLGLEAQKLWYTLGNHAFVRDYDLFGEREIMGWQPHGLPFGIVLGLGVLGLWVLARTSRAQTAQARERRALLLMLSGQLLSVLAANLLWFSSAQNRVPLAIPLSFAAGPALAALGLRARELHRADFGIAPTRVALAVCLALGLQAFWPRSNTHRPSSVHYYNLASVEEMLGRPERALAHYHAAGERSPDQPMFALREAFLARRLGHLEKAAAALDRLEAMPGLRPEIVVAAQAERLHLASMPDRKP